MALRNFIVRTLTVSLQKIVPVLRIGARSVVNVIVSRPFLFPASFFRNFFLSASSRLILDKSQVFPYFEEMQLSGRIVVYSILGCPHCMRAKNTLQELGLPYTDVRLDIFPQSVREEVKQRTGRTSVPQIFFNSIHIGGNDDLQELIQDKERLASLIELVKTTAPPEDAPVPPDPSLAIDSDPSHLVCEIDEYAELVAELKASGIIQNHRQGLKTLKNTFRGNDFVNWIVSTKQLEREQALEMGQQLIDRHFGHNLKSEQVFHDDDVYYRLMEDDNTSALNGGVITECEPQSASTIGEEIRNMILRLYGAFLSRDGKAVDYKGISGSSEFQSYLWLTKELQRVKILDASREEKLAFFINIYNALVIHANIVLGPPVNLWQRYKFFNTVKYIISGYEYSLQDIENGILRGNRKGVGMFTRPFSKLDPRLKIALEECEPLIHFALVCGAKSCPPIKTYKPEGVMEQLLLAAHSFFEGPDGCHIDLGRNTVSLSMIFKWYQEDFGKNTDEVLQWVFDHFPLGDKRDQLAELMTRKYKVSFMKYDWSINSK